MQYTVLPVGSLRANAYILYMPEREDALVIDPGAQPEAILKALDGRRLAAIVLTHGHMDHIGAVSALRGPDTPVYIHEADARMLVDPSLSLAAMGGISPSQGEADVLLREGEVTIAGVPLEVIHTPGHTPGSICLRCGEELFTGDTLFLRGYGRTDFPGGDARQMALSLRRLLALDGRLRVHPGHGEATTIAAERRYGL